jgi:hypothetical protein
MIPDLRQWDVVKVRINPQDRDEHPAVVISPDEIAGDPKTRKVNVLYGTSRRPGFTLRAHEVQLNSAEGLERATLFSCAHLYQVDPAKVTLRLGRVGVERRRQLGRKIVATFRLPL